MVVAGVAGDGWEMVVAGGGWCGRWWMMRDEGGWW